MRRPFPIYPGCPVCGDPAVNPGTLAVRWWWDDETALVTGRFVPGSGHAGYAGRLHGGVLMALFDEALAWASAVERRSYCYTGEMKVRFQLPSPLGKPLEISAWVATARGPYVRAEGKATMDEGALVATASGTYAAMERAHALELRSALRLIPGDVDILAETLRRP